MRLCSQDGQRKEYILQQLANRGMDAGSNIYASLAAAILQEDCMMVLTACPEDLESKG